MASSAVPVYFELSWAILSSIGLVNLGFTLMVIGIAGCVRVATVPLVVSIACAIANGLCYYAFYADNSTTATAVASAFADVAWLVQEAGLSFYSYIILVRVLRDRARLLFLSIFWTLILAISTIRMVILVLRIKSILGDSSDTKLQQTIDYLHVGYFTTIAVVECSSAFFLLRKFSQARGSSLQAALQSGTGVLFRYLMRSTEVRLALLAVIGIMRAVTYSFQNTAQSATTVAGECDRFAYTLECTFPMLMIIDILASRLVFASDSNSGSSKTPGNQSNGRARHFTQTERTDEFYLQSITTATRRIEVQGGGGVKNSRRTSSQEIIMHDESSRDGMGNDADTAASTSGSTDLKYGVINKTVEFRVSDQ